MSSSIYTELIGGLQLMVGLIIHPVAIAVFINMLVATITMMPKGFIVGGAFYPFSLIISSLIILLSGLCFTASITCCSIGEKKWLHN
ncbi:DoxX family membrane protein [Solitalea lacus]|uniref:DoxX family membrane protein n=1 Tax=Solitalea lacus TaxID=2911172 RepID=UPI003B84AFA7